MAERKEATCFVGGFCIITYAELAPPILMTDIEFIIFFLF